MSTAEPSASGSNDEVNRDEVLLDFQACTGIEDVGEAILYLEQANWDLVNAIKGVLPHDSQIMPSERSIPIRDPPDPEPPSRIGPPPPQPKKSATTTPVDLNKAMIDLTDDRSDSSDVEDMTESFPEEDYFLPDSISSARQNQRFLIPENAPDEIIGTIQFSDNFAIRYGSCHPMFLHGTLEEAIREATQKPAKIRKMLAVYLHHDGSVMSNVFCQNILCSESIVSYLTSNFVLWGWDVTHESNRQMLLNSVGRSFGSQGMTTIRSIDKDRYPVIIIVSRIRSATEVVSVINSTVSVDELMGTLLNTVELYKTQNVVDIREEEEREARELVKREQDEAYELSLQADRAKDEAKKMEEVRKKREEEQRVEEESRLLAERNAMAQSLPEEPGPDYPDAVCNLRVRLPSGKPLSRRFTAVSPLKLLFDFLFSAGFPKEKFKFLTSYPKRDLTTLNEKELLKNIFSAQDTLIVEER